MKNEKILSMLPWPTEIPSFTEENAVENNDCRWPDSHYAPKSPLFFFAYTFEIKSETYLAIVFYVGVQLKYRMIFFAHDYMGQKADDLKVSKGGIEYLESSKPFERWYKGSKESAAEICNYFKWPYSTKPIQKIREMIKKIKATKLKEIHDRIRRSVDDVMLEIKPIPKDFERWVINGPLKKSKYIFYDYAKKKNLPGVCSECHQDVMVTRPRTGQKGICPNCKAKVTYKAVGSAGRIIDDTYASYIQKIKKGYVIRYFHIKKYYYQCTDSMGGHWKNIHGSYQNPQIELYEVAREFEADYRTYYVWEQFKQTGEYRFCQENALSSTRAYLYGKNCKNVFSTERSNRKYFPFNDFCNHGPPIHVDDFVKNIIRIPQLEYLAKAKLYHLTAEISDRRGSEDRIQKILKAKTLWDGLGIAKDYLPIIQKENMDLGQISLFAATIRFGKDQAVLAQRWLEKESAQYWNTANFMDITNYTSPQKGIKYLEEQRLLLINKVMTKYKTVRYKTVYDIQREWIDYLDNAVKLGYDVKNSFVLFPDHLPEAHDETALQRVAFEKKIAENNFTEIEKIAPDLNRVYGMKTNSLFIRAPRNYKELTKEGQELHHCVGTYAMRQAMKETAILFIRKVEDPDTPFYTLEYKNEEVQQVRGKNNCSTTPEVQQFVKAWEKKIKQNEQKQRLQLIAVAG